jgi:hypothetical protein
MAIQRKFTKRHSGITMKSGRIYSFRYQAWEHDPTPLIIMLYALEGIHPNTGHQWRFIQAINFSYVPRAQRKRFAKDWVETLKRSRDPRFTWELVKRKYPYLEIAVRRYFFKPKYYIQNLKEVPLDDTESAIVSTWNKDFSKRAMMKLASKYKKASKFMSSRLSDIFGGKI